MTGSTHIAAGFVVGCGLCAIVQPTPELTVTAVITAAISSLLPDIDTASSKIGCRIAPLAWILRILFGHRQFFHSLFCWIVVSGVAWLLLGRPIIALSIFLGSISHLLLDMLNPSGVQLFWPLPKKVVLAHLRCGGLIDRLLTLLFTGLSLWLGYLCIARYL